MTAEMEDALREALRRTNERLKSPALENVTGETDVFGAVDSFTIVDLLLETEAVLEERNGRYIALADEKIFDATQSPLLKWRNWVAYVEQRHAG